jgi:hypothetical protein
VRAEVKLGRGKPQGQLLALGHLDTVYAVGTLEKMPFRVRGSGVVRAGSSAGTGDGPGRPAQGGLPLHQRRRDRERSRSAGAGTGGAAESRRAGAGAQRGSEGGTEDRPQRSGRV